MHPVLPSGPIPLTPPSLIIGFCKSGRQLNPSILEGDPRVVECFGDPSPMLARIERLMIRTDGAVGSLSQRMLTTA